MKKITSLFSIIILAMSILFILSFPAEAIEEKVEKPWEIYGPDKPMTRMMSNHYSIEANHVITLGQNCHYPDDVMVTLEISRATGMSPQRILDLRKEGKSWLNVMKIAGYSPAGLFTPVSGPVPQVFRHTYGQYERWRTNPGYSMQLYDKEIRNLAGLKFMVGRFQANPIPLMERRGQGVTFTRMAMERI